jgi:Dockerin type I domain
MSANRNKLRRGWRWLVGCVLAAAVFNVTLARSARAAELASGVMLFQQINASTFRYNIDLKDTGTTAIGTLWYSWVPGEDFLGSSPTNLVSPPGWSASVTHEGANDGFAIQWVNNNGPLQPGATLLGFKFEIANTPTALAGNSPAFPGTPIGTSFIYAGAPLSDAGAQLNIVPTNTPWRNPFAAFDVDNNGRVTAIDAAIVISDLLMHGNRSLGVPAASDGIPPFIDVNGSNSMSATDALLLVNDLLLHGNHAATAQTAPLSVPSAQALIVAVPEPASAIEASFAFAALVAAWWARGRRRRNGAVRV